MQATYGTAIRSLDDKPEAVTTAAGKDQPASAPPPPQTGFTLLEILVVIAILGLLIGLVAPAALRQLGGARVSVARQSIERLGAVLDMYKLDTGTYPTTRDGLTALMAAPGGTPGWNGPYIKGGDVPLDAWNHAYLYSSPSTRTGRDYDLCSRGPSGQAAAADMICNQ